MPCCWRTPLEKCHNCDERLQGKVRRCPHCGHMNRRITPQPFISANMDRVLGFVLGAILMCIALSGLIIVPVLLVCLHEKRPQFCSGLVAGLAVVNAVLLGVVLNCVWEQYSPNRDESDASMPAAAALDARTQESRVGSSGELWAELPETVFAIAISAGEIFGRFGCYFGGCCYGKSCNLPWAVYQHGAFRHPTQIYLSLANFAILGILLIYNRKSPPESALFYIQAALYSIFRFVMEFWRETPPPVMGLSIAQWACIVGFLFFSYRFTKLRKCVPSLCPDAVSASKS